MWVVGADVGDGDDGVDSLLTGGEAEFDDDGGYNLFDHKGAKPFMVQLLGQMGGCIVLCIQPNLSSNFVGRCRASLAIIVPCHLIHGMLKSSFHLILHLRHSLGKVVCSLYSRAPGRLQAHLWVLA